MNEYERWLSVSLDDPDLTEELKAIEGKPEEINDRFYRNLEFGTGGLRGVIGAGTNRMNVYTVRKATQGLANYLNNHKAEGAVPSVAIAHDSRIKGDTFARESAAVLAANGIKAYLYPQLMPTPALSYAVRYLKCDAGICVTASHNPAKYNGYKAYGSDGCQVTLEMADEILAEINSLDIFADVKKVDFEEGLKSGMIAPAARLRVAPVFSHRMFFAVQGARYIVLVLRNTDRELQIRVTWRTAEYPFAMRGKFFTSDSGLNAIYELCRHTQQICSADAYMDTPWREQGQWWGDARIQARNTFFLDGDVRLLRRGSRSIAGQKTRFGLTM